LRVFPCQRKRLFARQGGGARWKKGGRRLLLLEGEGAFEPMLSKRRRGSNHSGNGGRLVTGMGGGITRTGRGAPIFSQVFRGGKKVFPNQVRGKGFVPNKRGAFDDPIWAVSSCRPGRRKKSQQCPRGKETARSQSTMPRVEPSRAKKKKKKSSDVHQRIERIC